MVWLLRQCKACGRYTLKTDVCPKCGESVRLPHPAKFSLDDRYRKYRIKMRRMARVEEENTSST